MHHSLPTVLFAFVAGATGTASAAAAPQVMLEIVATDPPSPALLHANDTVYVRVHYQSDASVRIWVRPYLRGAPAAAMSNGSPLYPAGAGEALGWFSFEGRGAVDAIHVQAAAANSGHPSVDAAADAEFSWDGSVGARHQPAEWVAPLLHRQEEAQQQEYRAYANRPLGASGAAALGIFAVGVLASLAACFAWPVWGVLRWRGIWRALAALPLAMIILWCLKDCADLERDPTSHNLLPFEFIEAAVLIAPYMLVVWVLRRAARRRSAAP